MAESKDIPLVQGSIVESATNSIAVIFLVLGAVGIGFAPIFVRLSNVGPFATGFWRVALAVPVLILMSMLNPNTRFLRARQNWRAYGLALLAGGLFGGDLAVWHLSIHYTTVANATLLSNCAPIIIALWGWIFLKKPVKKLLVLGLIITLSGVILLINPHFGIDRQTLIGDILGLITAFFLASYILVTNRARKKISTVLLMTLSTLGSLITLFFITWFSGESFIVSHLSSWLVLLGLAFITHILGQGLIAYALPYLPVTFSSAALIVQPIVAAAAGWLLFSEILSTWQIVGIITSLMGIYLTKLSG
jgi:drug/metabolite transporter (DMT)-like permease